MVSQLFADTIPLRKTDSWDLYEEIEDIPEGYGIVTSQPIQYNKSATIWVIFNHAIAGIVDKGVKRHRRTESSFEFYNGKDSANLPVSFLELRTSATASSLSVTSSAKLHPTTGQVMTNPADVVWDIFGKVRSNAPESKFDAFKKECDEFGIEIAGVLNDSSRKVKEIFDEIAMSIGAVWGGAIPSLFRLYPRTMPTDEYIHDYFTVENITKVTNNICSQQDLFTDLVVNYDFDFALNKARKTLTLRSTELYKQIGSIPKTIDLKWINQNFLASEIGTRLLEYLSRKIWKIDFIARKGAPSGGWVNFQHPFIPQSLWGNAMVLSTVENLFKPLATYSIEMPVGSVPDIELISSSEAFDPEELQ